MPENLPRQPPISPPVPSPATGTDSSVSQPATSQNPPPLSHSAMPTKKRSILPIILIVVFSLIAILAAGISTGLLSRVVPGLGSVTLTYWGLWESEESLRPIFDEFEKTHPGIKVRYEFQSHTQYAERLAFKLKNNDGPDIFRVHNTWTPVFKEHMAEVPDSVFSVAEYEKTFYPVTRSDFKVNNVYLAVPLEIDGIAMFINNDLLSKAGLPVPEDWSDLRNAAIAMSVCASQNSSCLDGGRVLISGAALGSTQNIDHWQDIISVLLLQNGINLTNFSSANAGPIKDVFDYYKSFASTYRMWDPNLPPSTLRFASNEVGIYFGPSWRVFDIQNLNPNLNFSVHPLPRLPVDQSRGEKPVTYASYWAEAVNKQGSHQSQSWELIKYLSSPEVMRKMYQQVQSQQRSFGEPYSRLDLASELQGSEFVGPFISQAPTAKSWYLVSYTHDGQNGINTKLSTLFATALSGRMTIPVLATEVNTILSQYGIMPTR